MRQGCQALGEGGGKDQSKGAALGEGLPEVHKEVDKQSSREHFRLVEEAEGEEVEVLVAELAKHILDRVHHSRKRA